MDAAPAALVGSALLGMNIEGGSKEALAVVPVLTFFVAVWLFAFYSSSQFLVCRDFFHEQ